MIEYLTREIHADCKTIAELLEISHPRTRVGLVKMDKEGIIMAEDRRRNRPYRLKL